LLVVTLLPDTRHEFLLVVTLLPDTRHEYEAGFMHVYDDCN